MTRLRFAMPLTLAALSLACAALAADDKAEKATAVFLTEDQYDPARLLPPPPEDGTPPAVAEVLELRRIQEERSAARLEKARTDDKTENATIFAVVLGPKFDLKTLPATDKLMSEVRKDEKAAATRGKNLFRRTRPYLIDASLEPCSKNDAPKSSYPSGHATMAYSMAVVLADLVPEKAQGLMARASDYSESRLICGAHFRRDIVAGEALGTTVGRELLANPKFQVDLEAARAELKTAGVIGQ
ncbi:MAG: phosphatase PAP2 family protein [Proteobacteria bacterium]|nr:phosphatase PAP2 family protein [Pseudomonadota bacterium]